MVFSSSNLGDVSLAPDEDVLRRGQKIAAVLAEDTGNGEAAGEAGHGGFNFDEEPLVGTGAGLVEPEEVLEEEETKRTRCCCPGRTSSRGRTNSPEDGSGWPTWT